MEGEEWGEGVYWGAVGVGEAGEGEEGRGRGGGHRHWEGYSSLYPRGTGGIMVRI